MTKVTTTIATRTGQPFGAELEAVNEPDPMNYWKPEPGDLIIGWVAGLNQVPNRFFDPGRPVEGNNVPQQTVCLLIEDETDMPILIYASGAVLRRLFDRGPSQGAVTRPPRVGDHIALKRVADDVPRQKGQKGMKQFVLRIDPEPPTMPTTVSDAISALEYEKKLAAADNTLDVAAERQSIAGLMEGPDGILEVEAPQIF